MRLGHAGGVEEIRRPDDGELCGHVEMRDGDWAALVVFGAELGRHRSREAAVDQVLSDGLSSLAHRWTLEGADSGAEVVCVQEANEQRVTLALGYYSLPGVPVRTVTRDELTNGTWTLRR